MILARQIRVTLGALAASGKLSVRPDTSEDMWGRAEQLEIGTDGLEGFLRCTRTIGVTAEFRPASAPSCAAERMAAHW